MNEKKFTIATLKGDGIGIDVTNAAIAVAEAASRKVGGIELDFEDLQGGAGYFAESGSDLGPDVEKKCEDADAIFVGAIGLPHIRHDDGTEVSPHLRLREQFQLYAGVRPVRAYPNSPQRLADPRARDIDLIILRESTEGLFYSAAAHGRSPVANDEEVQDILRITRPTTEKLHDFAFKLAEKRKSRGGKGRVTCVDKANVFRSMALFRKIFDERAADFPDILGDYNYVDAQALNLIRNPWDFDVLVMENMFGDILSDLAGGLVGGMGMAACAEIGDQHGLFQPAHGSAPDIMGEDKANPLAAILSAALMLDFLFDCSDHEPAAEAARIIDDAVQTGFERNVLRPMEFGGDMGTRAMVSELLSIIEN